jgi:hypothetical protein
MGDADVTTLDYRKRQAALDAYYRRMGDRFALIAALIIMWLVL